MSAGLDPAVKGISRIDFVSGVNGRRYSVSLALPIANRGNTSLPVLYVLDGYYYFASVVEAARANWNAPQIVVVGIGYPDDSKFVIETLARHKPLPEYLAAVSPWLAACALERFYDLTLPASEAVLIEQRIGGLFAPRTQDVGGLDDFLTVLKSEVMPRVASAARVDAANQAIFGHSLGGLAVLHALFSDPNTYRTFIAASPSIWWNHRAVLAKEGSFSAAVCAGSASPRVLITMGGDEALAPSLPLEFGVDPGEVARAVRHCRMVENARELTLRLQQLPGTPHYHVADFLLFPHLGHGLAPWPSIAYAIQFALQ